MSKKLGVALSRQQIVAATLVFAAAITIGVLTLTSLPAGFGSPGFFCMLCDEKWLADSLLNVLLFVPLGVGLERLGIAPKRVFLISLACSTLIELLQATVVTGRDSSLRDIITNATGGWLGATLANSWSNWVAPKFSRRRRFATLVALLWPSAILTSMWAAEPATDNSRLFGQYAPKDTILPEFKGEILRAAFNRVRLPVGAFQDQYTASSAFKRRDVWLSATVSQPPPTLGTATIVAVVDAREAELLTISQSGDDLLCHVRLRSERFGLNSPTLRLKHVFGLHLSNASLDVAGGLRGATVSLEARSGQLAFSNALSLTPGGGWMFLYPFDLTSPSIVALLGFLWMTILALALQYFWSLWIRSSVGYAILLPIPAILTAVLLAVAPSRFGSAPASTAEILGLGTGLVLGQLLSRLVERLECPLDRQAAASKPLP